MRPFLSTQRSFGALKRLPENLSATVLRSCVFTFQRETRRPPPSEPSQARRWPSGAKIKPFDLPLDRKSTRLNSSHLVISYAVFCLKKKKPSAPADPSRTTATRRELGRSDI